MLNVTPNATVANDHVVQDYNYILIIMFQNCTTKQLQRAFQN